MKLTQEQVIAWAREAGDAEGLSEFFFHPVIERFASLAYEAGRKDENEACVADADWCIQNHLEHLVAERIRARSNP